MDTNYIDLWTQNMLDREFTRLSVAMHVEGSYRRAWDPPQSAQIEIIAEPSASFSVSFDDLDSQLIVRLNQASMLNWAVFGILDVLAVQRQIPVFGVRIRFLRVIIDDFSTNNAFRMAGRDAARRILDAEFDSGSIPRSPSTPPETPAT